MPYPWTAPAVIAHTHNLLSSFRHWLGKDLLPLNANAAETVAERLFLAPFAVLSHGTETDPVLNYGNQTALELWSMNGSDFTQMPSRLTAEAHLREVRSQCLMTAAQQGYLTGYKGVRISRTGRRFLIQNATLWKVLNPMGQHCGQAATFSKWEFLP